MRLETFFDNFELLTDAPNGVQKLRKLILQLAVRGKLVPQAPTDEPASVLLDKIKAKKEWLIENNKIRKDKPLPPIEPSEIPYDLLDGWNWARLGDIIISITGGGTPSKNNPQFWGGSIPWASVKDLRGSKYLETTIDFITEIGIQKSSTNLIPKGRLLICTRMGLGKIAINSIDVAINQDLKAVELADEIDVNYFYNFYLTQTIIGTGVTVSGIRQSELLSFVVPIPPLNEQKRIVAKVEQLMALCDELEARQQKRREGCVRLNNAALDQLLTTREPDDFSKHWQRICDNFDLLYSAPENIGKLRQAILQLAVQGKLVPQDPNDEPASVLLEKIKAEKKRLIKEKKIRKDKPPPPIKLDEEPYELPEGWNWVRLGETAKIIEYGTSEKASEIDVGTPILRMNNIDAGKVMCSNLKYVPSSIKDLPRLYLCYNDILFNRTNSYELVGKTGVFKGENDSFTFASYLIRVSFLLEFVQPDFVNIAMNSEYYRKTQLEPEITQQTGQANFNGTKLANTMIPLPPPAEQKRIVAKVEQLTILCDELQAKLIQSQTDSEKLMDAAMRQVLTE